MKRSGNSGISVIELLVVMSTITVLLAVGVPKFEDFAIRARVSEGLTIAAAARQAMRETCATNPGTKIHNPDDAGFGFTPTKHVSELIMSADCGKQRMWVGVITRNTGAYSDPYISFVIVPTSRNGRTAWACKLIRGEARHVPTECQSKNT